MLKRKSGEAKTNNNRKKETGNKLTKVWAKELVTQVNYLTGCFSFSIYRVLIFEFKLTGNV